MCDPRACLRQQLDFALIHVYTMDSKGLRSKNACIMQSMDDTLPRPAQAVLLIGFVLGDMYVKADPEIARSSHAIGQSLVG